MSDARATIEHSILMGLSEHGGKRLDAESGTEIVESILQYLFCDSTIWSVEEYLKLIER